MEVVGVLPCPATRANLGAADLLETQLFAYGVGSSVAVVEVHELQLACLLQGGHRNNPVTSVKWCPDCHSRDLKSHTSHVRLASGDAAGGVAVWSLLSGSVISRLEDHFAVREHVKAAARGRDVGGSSGGGSGAAAAGGPSNGGAAGVGAGGAGEGGVVGLAWVMASSAVLAVLLSPGLLLLWDTKGGAVLWKRALPLPDVWQGLQVDPLDCRSLAVSSCQGGLALVSLDDPAAERVAVRLHRVGVGAGATAAASHATSYGGAAVCPRFCATRGLLFLLLPREIIVYDTELGTPVASRPLPPGCAPFASLLGVYGSGVSAGTGDEGGCDCLYVGHVDGGVTVFVRSPGELRYQVAYSGRLTPPSVRGSRQPPALLAVCGGLWRGRGGDPGPGGGGVGGVLSAGSAAAAAGGELGLGGLPQQATPELIHAATQRLRAAFLPPGHSQPQPHGHQTHPRSSVGGMIPAQPPGPPGTTPTGPGDVHTSPPGQPQQRSHPPHWESSPAGGHGGATAADMDRSCAPAPASAASCSQLLILVALTTDGRVWRWDAPLPRFPAELALPSLPPPSGLSAAGQSALVRPSPPSALLPPPAHQRPRPVAAPPQLAGLLHTLPSAVTTFALYPRPVAAASLRSLAAGGGGEEGGCGVVLLGAAGTVGGGVELFAVQRGLVAPLSLHVSSSFTVHRDAPVRGVRWLGATPRLVTFSSDRGANGLFTNHLTITDVRSGRSVTLPRGDYLSSGPGGGPGAVGAGSAGAGPGGAGGAGGESCQLLGVRASPCGCYLLVLLKGASAELWGVWPGAAPARLRLLDLPFSCVEWVQPPLLYSGQPVRADDVTTWAVGTEPPPGPQVLGTPSAAPSVGRGSQDGSGSGAVWSLPLRGPPAGPGVANDQAVGAAPTDTSPPHPPPPVPHPHPVPVTGQAEEEPAAPSASAVAVEEGQLVFTLTDGRAGVLSVRGRRLADTRVKRPMAGLLSPLDMTATAMGAVGRLVVMGDAEGRLAVWEWSSGRTTVQTTGLGLVRKIVIAPPPAAGAPPVPPPGRAAAGPAPSPPFGSSPSLALQPENSLARPLLPHAPSSPPPHMMAPPLQPHFGPTGAMWPGGGGDPHPGPYTAAAAAATVKARVAVLFASGHCGVFDLEGTNKLRPVAASATAGVRPVLDVALLPFWWLDPAPQAAGPAPASGSVSLMAVVTDEGSLSVLDLSTAGAPLASAGMGAAGSGPGRPSPARTSDGGGGGAGLETRSPQHVGSRRPPLGGGAGSRAWALKSALQPPPVSQPSGAAAAPVSAAAGTAGVELPPTSLRLHLAQARGLASCLLLPRPWAMLLRLLLQLGVSQELLRYLCGSYSPGEAEEEDVRHELLALFPRAARGPLLALLADHVRLENDSSHDAATAVTATAARPAAAPAIGALRIPAHASGGSKAGGGAAGRSAGASGGPGGAHDGGAGGGGSHDTASGTAASTILAISNSVTSTLALSGNMLRAVSNSLASTLTAAGSGGSASSSFSPAAAPPATPPPPGPPSGGAGAAAVAAAGDAQLFGSPAAAAAGVLTPLPFHGNLLHLLRLLASMRAQGRLLHPDEWLSYSRAVAPGASPAERMAVAAQVAGDSEEARFWSHLPVTLSVVAARGRERDKAAAHAAAGRGGTTGLATTTSVGAPAAPAAPQPPPPARVASGGLTAFSGLQRIASASAITPFAENPLLGGPVAAPPAPAPAAAAPPAAASGRRPTGAVEAQSPSVVGGGAFVLLWDERLVLAEAQERVKWREAHSGAVLDMDPEHQERRLLEYMALGDLQTAVAFLLASSPENSARYYRDALCTLALAAAASAAAAAAAGPNASHSGAAGSAAAAAAAAAGVSPRAGAFGGGAGGGGGSCMLLAQSAKVISAHAASIGDVLLGVPLHLAAGLHGEAALVLQESGMWRLAAVMAAHSLDGQERAQTLSRWALHVWRQEGSVWRAAGLLTAAGCLREALRLLLEAGLPDCAAAFIAACKHAGLETALAPPPPPPPADAAAADGGSASGGEAWVLPSRASGSGSTPAGNTRPISSAFADATSAAAAAAAASTDAGSFSDGGLAAFESLDSGSGLGLGVRVPGAATGGASAGAAADGRRGGGSAELGRASAEFERFVSDLLSQLL